MKLTVILPLPPPELSPNSRCHWAKKAKVTNKYRVDAFKAMTAAICNARLLKSVPWRGDIGVRSAFFFKAARRRDRDNALASLKAAFDGVADAGLVFDDDQFVPYPAVLSVDRGNPRVELTFTTEGER